MLELNRLYLMDCMEGMAQFPDKYFELAIVDPPYGIAGMSGEPYRLSEINPRGHKAKKNPFCGAGKLKNRALNIAGRQQGRPTIWPPLGWDVAPIPDYFAELCRISQNQIIWGGNYFNLPPTRCFVIWDKAQPWNNFSAAEYAWTNFDYPSKMFRLPATLAVPAGERIHPTQKPIALYDFCLRHFAKPGDKILDTHAGSASCLIAAHEAGHDYIGFEIDPDYYAAACARLDKAKAQSRLFFDTTPARPVQTTFLTMEG